MKVNPSEAQGRSYDLCVVGAGPAGIIVALEYQALQPKSSILLIEYGIGNGVARNQLDDTINVVESLNHHLPYDCTNKGMGGSSASWGGRCVMYDEIDFMPRKILGGQCTWNTRLFQETKKYAGKTAEYFECGEPQFNVNDIPSFAGSRIAEGFQSGEVTDSVVERYSKPTRFGQRYRSEIELSPTIHLLTGWEVFSIEVSAPGAVSKIEIRDFARRRDRPRLARAMWCWPRERRRQRDCC